MSARVDLAPPWLTFHLGARMQVLGWCVNSPGFVQADRILWREVRNADLPADLDVRAWLCAELAARDAAGVPCMLTSRRLDTYVVARARAGGAGAMAVVTVGLSNAERVGHRMDRAGRDWDREPGACAGAPLGTVNVGVRLDAGLSQTGLLEALSIATEARTAAIMDADIRLPVGRATGTGTDCIAIAAPAGTQDYAGLHTDAGAALGRAVHDAVLRGARDWQSTVGRLSDG